MANLLNNSSFENSTAWTKGGLTGNVTLPSTDFWWDAYKSVKVAQSSTGCYIYQDVTTTPGDTMFFSAYAKITAWTAGTLLVQIKSTDFANLYGASTTLGAVADWTRLSGSFTVAGGVTAVRFILDQSSATLTGYWDAAMFEVSSTLNSFAPHTTGTLLPMFRP